MMLFIQFLLLIELILIIPSEESPRYGFSAEFLHADNELISPTVIESKAIGSFMHRSKRTVNTLNVNAGYNATINTTNKISVVVSFL